MSTMSKLPFYVLGYNGADYFNRWYDKEKFPNIDLRIVDNGNQEYPEELKDNVIWQTTKNLGCAGGWNLILRIATEHYKEEKVIVGQEDARISEEILQELYRRCTPEKVIGTYNNSFDFSVYCIHKETLDKVGLFDDNILFAGCEDDDYKYRCKLAGVSIESLGISNSYNISIANNAENVPSWCPNHNADYVKEKWGSYTFAEPFNGKSVPLNTERFVEVYGDLDEFLEEEDFKEFRLEN